MMAGRFGFRWLAIACLVVLASSMTAYAIIMFSRQPTGYTFVISQKPGGGTSMWTQIIVPHLEQQLGKPIMLKHIPGQRDQAGFNKYHNVLRFDDSFVMVSKGGNASSFLVEKVDYDYDVLDPIVILSYNVVVGIAADMDWKNDKLLMAAGSGNIPEAMAIALLIGGPDAPDNFHDHITWVKGMSPAERRLAFRRGELNVTRENVAAFKKHVDPDVQKGKAKIWFHHGILNPQTVDFVADANINGPTLEALYEETWGVPPSGDFYDAYRLAKAWRDGLQKSIWVNKENPNKKELRDAVLAMLSNTESMAKLHVKIGNYPWHVGGDAEILLKNLKKLVTRDALQTYVRFNTDVLEMKSLFNKERVYVNQE